MSRVFVSRSDPPATTPTPQPMIPADTNWAATSVDGTSAQTEPVNVFVATKASSAVCATYNLLLLALAAMAH